MNEPEIKGPDDEATELLKMLPHHDAINTMKDLERNAHVYIDPFGRLAILVWGLPTYCWLGIDPKHVVGDQAPFCG